MKKIMTYKGWDICEWKLGGKNCAIYRYSAHRRLNGVCGQTPTLGEDDLVKILEIIDA